MLGSLRKTPKYLSHLQSRVKFPAKFKGTIVEKWADYWKNLFIDYRQMLKDLRTDAQENPRKALIWTATLASIYGLAKNTPNEIDFKDQMKMITNDAILVSEECRNPKSIDHLRLIQSCYNEGNIHYKNFGIISFMYISDFSSSCDLYKRHCSYLEPTYFNHLFNIIDVGFMGRWWNVYIKTNNYDVNV